MATDIIVADQQQQTTNSSSSSSSSSSDLNNNINTSAGGSSSNTNENNSNDNVLLVEKNGANMDANGEWEVVYNQKEKHRLKQTKQQQQQPSQNDKTKSSKDKQKQQENGRESTTTNQQDSKSNNGSGDSNTLQQTKQNANPWAKLPQVAAIHIQQQQSETQPQSSSSQTKKDQQLNTSSTSQSSSSSFNLNTSTTTTSSSIQPSNNNTTTTTNNSSNLDYMDWPSLSDVNSSINNSQTIKKNVGITQSKSSIELNDIRNHHTNNKKPTMNSRKFKSQSSFNENDEITNGGVDDCIYDDEYDNSFNNNDNNNTNTKSSINGELNESSSASSSGTSGSGSGNSNNCSSDESKENNKSTQQTKQQIKKKQKWKPLIIDAGKRERRTYRSSAAAPHTSSTKPSSSSTHHTRERARSLERSNENSTNIMNKDITEATLPSSTTTNYHYNQYATHIPHSSTTYSGFHKYKKYPKSESTRSFRHYATHSSYKLSTSRSDNIHDNYKDYIYSDETTQIILKDIDAHCNIAYTTTAIAIPPQPPYHLVDYNNQFEALKELIKNQIEYYFSDENLNGDIYLRRKMDANGYIEVALICSFNRVKSLTQDHQLIIDSIQSSDQLELSEDYLRVRRRTDPLKWPLPSLIQTLNPDVPEFVPKFMLQKSNNEESVHINAELDRLLSTTSEPENELLIGNKQNTMTKQQQKQNDYRFAAATSSTFNLSSLSLH